MNYEDGPDPPTNDALFGFARCGETIEVHCRDGCVTRGLLRMKSAHTWLIVNPSGQHFLFTGRIARVDRLPAPACALPSSPTG